MKARYTVSTDVPPPPPPVPLPAFIFIGVVYELPPTDPYTVVGSKYASPAPPPPNPPFVGVET